MFNYGHVYFYLVESVVNMNLPSDARTNGEDFVDCMAKPLKKGRNLLTSGFVDNVQDNTTNSSDYVLRGHVHHSMKNLLALSVTVVISGCSGNIKKALCTCKASSIDRCAHNLKTKTCLELQLKANCALHLSQFLQQQWLFQCPQSVSPYYYYYYDDFHQ